MSARVEVGPAAEIGPGDVRCVPLGDDEFGLPREAIVLRDQDGTLRAYINACRHLPIPLDSGSREFFDDGPERHLLCNTHGALFRRDDGMCIHGPCKGMPLIPVELVDDEGILFLIEPAPDVR